MESRSRAHETAVDAFVDAVEDAELDDVQRLVLFGSVARGTHRSDSDVDVLAVLATDADVPATEERLRDLAYDVMLDHGAVFSIHGIAEPDLADRSEHPFFDRVRAEGRTIYG